MGEAETSHCFPLNGNFDEPEICGIDGILTKVQEQGVPLDGSVICNLN